MDQDDGQYAKDYFFGDLKENDQAHIIIVGVNSMKYRLFISYLDVEISQVIEFLKGTLIEDGIKLNECLYFDYKNNLIQDGKLTDIKFLHFVDSEKIQKKQIQQEYLVNKQEIELFLASKLKENEILSLKAALQSDSFEKDSYFKVFPKANTLNVLKIIFIGPIQTPYENGIYQIQCTFPEKNPYIPMLDFTTPIFHQNIINGTIGFNPLFDQTNPGITFKMTIYQIISLLSNPRTDFTMDSNCFKQYTYQKDIHDQIAENYKIKYAQPSKNEIITDLIGDVPQQSSLYQELEQVIQQLMIQSQSPLQNQAKFQIIHQNQKLKRPRLEKDKILSRSLQNYQLQDQNNYMCSTGFMMQRSILQVSSNDSERIKRLKKEINECPITDKEQMFKIFPSRMFDFVRVFFLGPKNTHFENGIYQLDLFFTQDYPQCPPRCSLNTKIFHPNILDNFISLDRFQDYWSEILTIRTLMLSIISFLDDPNTDNPLNYDCAKLYKYDRKSYDEMVVQYKFQYASPTIECIIEEAIGITSKTDPDFIYLKGILTEWISYWKSLRI